MRWCLMLIPLVFMAVGGRAEPEEAPRLALQPVERFLKLPPGRNLGPAAAVAVGPKGQIYVLHRGVGHLAEFDRNGQFVRDLAVGMLTKPHGLHVDGAGDLWVTDVGAHVVLKLSPAGELLMVQGVHGQAAEWHEEFNVLAFNQPTDVATGPAGDVYVTDGYGNSRVVKLAADGRFVKAWGSRGSGPGEFHSPHNVVVGRNGRVYVADRDNLRVQVFDADGTFQEAWTRLGKPNGLELVDERYLLVTDSVGERVLKVALDGTLLGAFGAPGKGPGQFAVAHSVAVASDGSLLIAEIANWRVQRLVPAE